jgi:hypothetical protein
MERLRKELLLAGQGRPLMERLGKELLLAGQGQGR